MPGEPIKTEEQVPPHPLRRLFGAQSPCPCAWGACSPRRGEASPSIPGLAGSHRRGFPALRLVQVKLTGIRDIESLLA